MAAVDITMDIRANPEKKIIHLIDMMVPEEVEVDQKDKASEKVTGVTMFLFTRKRVKLIPNQVLLNK